ncbi:MAG: LamG domain-containing protein, partial [bacterium]
MKMHISLWIAAVLLMVVGAPLGAAPQTTNWPFTTPSQYVESSSNRIEVAGGVAKLILQNNSLEATIRADYLTNAAQLTAIGLGGNANVGLMLSNGLYTSNGIYTSRVFDGGEGNIWNGLAIRFSNNQFGSNALSSIQLSDSGIVNDPDVLALYHFDGTWSDEAAGGDGTPVNSPTFTNDAYFGSQALLLNGSNYFQTANSTLLNSRSSGSIAFWVKLASPRVNYAGLVMSRINSTDGNQIGVSQVSTKTVFYISNTYSIPSIKDIPLGSWCFVVATFGAGKMALYMDGQLQGTNVCPAVVTQGSPFFVGSESLGPTYRSSGIFDEVAIYGRTLSAKEVQNLYYSGSSFGVKVRSWATNSSPGIFVGPNGDAGKYFINQFTLLTTMPGFNPYDQYLQYEATFYPDKSRLQTPYLESLKFLGTAGELVDDIWGDYIQGVESMDGVMLPTRHDTPLVTLGAARNGVVSNGLFTSRVFDASTSVNWTKLVWDRGVELSTPLLGLEGLWHMNNTWDDGSGKGHPFTVSGASFSPYAKLGSASGVFNGSDNWVNVGSLGSAVQTIEFWVNGDRPTMPILELGASSAWLAVSNNLVTVNGWSGVNPAIYVNGGLKTQLLPGWNHVAVVSPSAVNADNVTFGSARGAYFKGMLDEVAVYNRALPSGEIAGHCVTGRREAAGRVQLQARADNVNPPQADFVGRFGTTNEYFIDPVASSLPGAFTGKRYFQ